jgi:hypothetical protein
MYVYIIDERSIDFDYLGISEKSLIKRMNVGNYNLKVQEKHLILEPLMVEKFFAVQFENFYVAK